jgi:cytochrome oxidase Cu insertion factor (SCO1/SenC/PrrC family)
MDEQLSRRTVLAGMGVGIAALAGCVSGDGSDDSTPGGDDTNGGANSDEPGNGDDANSGETGAGDRPAWQTTAFQDARTGETLTIADADGPVVLHTFATWCSVCHSQQQNLDTLHERRGDEVTMVDLTIDENDDPGDVADHAASNGFDWRFGVAPAELTSSLVDDIGDRVVFAPQSPVIVVCPDGTAESLGKGVSADEIASTIDSNCA